MCQLTDSSDFTLYWLVPVSFLFFQEQRRFSLQRMVQTSVEPVFYGDLVYKFKGIVESLISVINLKVLLNVIKSGMQHGYHATVCMSGCETSYGHDGGSCLRLNDGS